MITILIGIATLIFWSIAILIELFQLFAPMTLSATPVLGSPLFIVTCRWLLYLCVVTLALKCCGTDVLIEKILASFGNVIMSGFASIRGKGASTEEDAVGILKKAYGNPDRLEVDAVWTDGRTVPRVYGVLTNTSPAAASDSAQQAAPATQPTSAAPKTPAAGSPTAGATQA